MNWLDIEVVRTAKYYTALNLLRSEVDGSAESNKKVKRSFRNVMNYAHVDKGGSKEWAIQMNSAKNCLLDNEQR